MQHFYDQGHLLEETVIVGHLPTSNYYSRHICNDIIIDKEKKIICIDGGTGVKSISQLNALIIEQKEGQVNFSTKRVQPLPIYFVSDDVYNYQDYIHKIGFPYFEVTIEKAGEQFSECYQADTHQRLMIKNEFLYQRDDQTYCLDDYTDQLLSISAGEYVKLIGIYGEWAYVVYNHQVGWIKQEYLEQI